MTFFTANKISSKKGAIFISLFCLKRHSNHCTSTPNYYLTPYLGSNVQERTFLLSREAQRYCQPALMLEPLDAKSCPFIFLSACFRYKALFVSCKLFGSAAAAKCFANLLCSGSTSTTNGQAVSGDSLSVSAFCVRD